MADQKDDARVAFDAGEWQQVVALLSGRDDLTAPALERLAIAASMLGLSREALDAWQQAHRAALERGTASDAVRYAFWIAMELILRQDFAQMAGWLARAQRLVEESDDAGVGVGYLLLVQGRRTFDAGDPAAARELFERSRAIAAEHGDHDLTTLARHAEGRVRVRQGDTATGMSLLDEAMVSVTGGETSPLVAGVVYCSVLEACFEVLDHRRAREWTAALSEWLGAQPGVTRFRGECLVYRAEVRRVHGAWAEAIEENALACDELLRPPPHPAAGSGLYQRAELARLTGDVARAEAGYLDAEEHGRDPQPGLALLRLAQGRTEDAEAMIRRALGGAADVVTRDRSLAAGVEILLAAGDLPAARGVADELEALDAERGVPLLRATALHAGGAVRLAEGEPEEALGMLREALQAWRDVDSPYGTARTRAVLAACHEAIGDTDAAELERSRARAAFERLGAVPALAELGGPAAPSPTGLTGRELEVLGLVAAGKTNRAIAGELFISEKTVARHVSNIFTKIDVSSRSAATAYAYEHHLV